VMFYIDEAFILFFRDVSHLIRLSGY